MVRYLPDRWQAGLTTNGNSYSYGTPHPFALRYRRAKGTFYEVIKVVENLLFFKIALPDEIPSGNLFFLHQVHIALRERE